MSNNSNGGEPRFRWPVFRGRCRRNLIAGMVLLALGMAYAAWAGQRFSTRGADSHAFDQPLVRYGAGLVGQPIDLRNIVPQNERELYLVTVISDQNDVMVGLTILLLRMIISMSAGGLGMVLLTAGATEWELRSRPPGFNCLAPAAEA